jgi:hypothetical protein
MSRVLAVAVLALVVPATASADPLLPPKGKVYSGMTGSKSVGPFAEQVGKHPSVFGEWALWDGDDPGFVRRFFSFVNSHKRVRMLLYNQGNTNNGPFRLSRYPESRKAIKTALKRKRFLGTP